MKKILVPKKDVTYNPTNIDKAYLRKLLTLLDEGGIGKVSEACYSKDFTITPLKMIVEEMLLLHGECDDPKLLEEIKL